MPAGGASLSVTVVETSVQTAIDAIDTYQLGRRVARKAARAERKEARVARRTARRAARKAARAGSAAVQIDTNSITK